MDCTTSQFRCRIDVYERGKIRESIGDNGCPKAKMGAGAHEVHESAAGGAAMMTTFLEAIRRRNMGVGMAWELSRAKEWTLA